MDAFVRVVTSEAQSYKFRFATYHFAPAIVSEMHSHRLSPSSSADSSRSGSPDTRATTPSSSSDCLEHSYLPGSYACIPGGSLSVTAVEELFKKHAAMNRLGLIVGQDFMDAAVQGEWTKQGVDTTEYFVSTTYAPPDSQTVCYLD